MAFIANEEEETAGTMDVLGPEEPTTEEAPSGTQPQTITQPAATVTAPTTTPSLRQGTGSGQFTNIQEYVQANKRATEKIAERLRARYEQRTSELGSDIKTRREALLGAGSQYAQERERLAGGQSFIEQQIAAAQKGEGPTQEAIEKYARFGGAYDPRLADPKFGQQEERLKKLQQTQQNLLTRKGRFGELQSLLRGGSYSRGERALDRQLLTLSKPTALRQETLAQPTRDIQEQLKTLRSDIETERGGFQTQRQQLQQEALSRLTGVGGAIPELQKTIEGRVTSERERVQKQSDMLRDYLARGQTISSEVFERAGITGEAKQEFLDLYKRSQSKTLSEKLSATGALEGGDLTDEDLRLMGVPTDQYEKIKTAFKENKPIAAGGGLTFRENLIGQIKAQEDQDLVRQIMGTRTGPAGFDISQYVQDFDPESIGKSQVATQEEFARSRALSSLAGQGSFLQQANIGRAGTAGDITSQLRYGEALQALRERYRPIKAESAGPGAPIPQPGDPGFMPETQRLAQQAINFPDITEIPGMSNFGSLFDTGKLTESTFQQAGKIADKFSFDRLEKGLGFDPTLGVGAKIGGATQILNLFDQKVVGSSVFKPISAAMSAPAAVVSAVTSFFCFLRGTLIKMENNKYKKIEDIKLGDNLFLGGEIELISEAYAQDSIYSYKNELMTGSHAAFDNGKWTRVDEIESAVKLNMNKKTIVYPIINKNHLLVTEGFISADFSEIDNGLDTDEEDKINILNKNIYRNEWLKKEEELLLKEKRNDKEISINRLSIIKAVV